MATEPTAIRALNRYAHTLYRLALLRDGSAAQAARATAAAFTALNWDEIALDDRLEGRLIAALPPVRRRLRKSPLPFAPHAFQQLPAQTRLALGMRLLRGHGTAAIAEALKQPVEETRNMLVGAVALLAGDDPAELPAECRQTRALRLDESGAGRAHLLVCEACRDAAQRWERTEQTLADALARGTDGFMLPRASLEEITARLQGPAPAPAVRWRSPSVLSLGVSVAVIAVVALIIVPRGRSSGTGRPIAAPRDLLRSATQAYGSIPQAEGVVHRRFAFDAGDGSEPFEAESWTDAAQPGRHRMQLSEGSSVVEWQVADGERDLRYMATSNRFCGQQYERYMIETGAVHAWQVPPPAQKEMHALRWQIGAWALGRRYLDQALAAPTVRSLGAVTENGTRVTTVLAEGGTLSGTLLIELDLGSSTLREIRHVVPDGGAMRSTTAWRLVEENSLTQEEAKKAGVFADLPVKTRPRVLERRLPILDPACPILSDSYVTSMVKTVGWGWPALIGFHNVPPGTERVFVAGRGRWEGGWRNTGGDESQHLVVYVAGSKRLILAAGYNIGRRDGEAIEAGDWHVHLHQAGHGRLEGTAVRRTLPSGLNSGQRAELGFNFTAEGWDRDELLSLLPSARHLTLADALAQRAYVFDPDPPPAAVTDLILPAMERTAPRPAKVAHSILRRMARSRPGDENLRDPYHLVQAGDIDESWQQWNESGDTIRYRSAVRDDDGTARRSVWHDGYVTEIYDARLNTVRRFRDQPFGRARWSVVDNLVASIFRNSQFTVVPDGPNVSLEATRVVSETDYQWSLDEQRRGRPNASGWPWLADLDPVTITFRTTFERTTKDLLGYRVYANGPHGSTLIEAVIVDLYEVLDAVPRRVEVWSPPVEADIIEEDLNANLSGRGTFTVFGMDEAVAGAPAPLWGWIEEKGIRFTQATVPGGIVEEQAAYHSFDAAVASGAATVLTYEWTSTRVPATVRLIEGTPGLLRRLLQQEPPSWPESEERTITLAGTPVQAWILREAEAADRPYQRRVIFETKETLVAVEYTGAALESEDALLAIIERLVRLT